MVLNYGAQLVFRSQEDDLLYQPPAVGARPSGEPPSPEDVAGEYERLAVGALVFLPDVWFRIAWRALTVEGEVSGVFGKLDKAGPLAEEKNRSLVLRQFGWALAAELRLYREAFFLGFESGGATGDQAEDPRAYLNYRWQHAQQKGRDSAITGFHFSPDYQIDQIFFRRIMGTVTNAFYVKPQIAYWLDLEANKKVGLEGSFVYSGALVPVATPGNAVSYGIEMDLGLRYRNTTEGFHAGVVWGVFWPLGALDRPETSGRQLFWPAGSGADAKAAQVLRFFLGVKF